VGGNGRDSLDGGAGEDLLIDYCGKNRYHQALGVNENWSAAIQASASWVTDFVANLAGSGDPNPNSGIQVMLKSGTDD
jgi:hypothetical protein